jgi:hypothetical protein
VHSEKFAVHFSVPSKHHGIRKSIPVLHISKYLAQYHDIQSLVYKTRECSLLIVLSIHSKNSHYVLPAMNLHIILH